MNFDCVFLSKDSSSDNGHGHEKRGLWETYALTASIIYPSCSSIERVNSKKFFIPIFAPPSLNTPQ